ncbi:hypothetical protein [Acidocella sp. KAb 2-4]|uniref:phage fiber-tail adaptor protein n=1 Tax=Acidocella sp. KAb 2-4 TaxID=2885158 RepID=UPI001D076A15|nr:hypothetical protein [Acidocella sp. KAb 2-4]MCB5944109.1 hypothetical protein [Acidocella sp. KAb 2-4]
MPTVANHLWRPSNARYVQIDGFVPTPRGAVVAPPLALAWPVKDPGDTLDYVFDIAPALAANPGDTIATLDVGISPGNPGDLTLASAAADGARAVMWLTGGQAGTLYTVTVSVTTAGGRALVRSIALPVQALSTAPVAVDALQIPSGQALTGPAGLPITTN